MLNYLGGKLPTQRNVDPAVAVELPVVDGHIHQGLLKVAVKCMANVIIKIKLK